MLNILLNLSNNLGHTSLQSCLPIFFSERLVQVCSCRHCLLSGVSWSHYKVSNSDVFLSCDPSLTLQLHIHPLYSRTGIIVRGSSHCEGNSWIGWRPYVPRNCPLSFKFLYTQGVVLQVRVARLIVILTSTPYIDHLELRYIFRQLRCIMKFWVGYLWHWSSPFSSRAPFLGCLLPQSRTWMALVEDQDGPGSSFSYVFIKL